MEMNHWEASYMTLLADIYPRRFFAWKTFLYGLWAVPKQKEKHGKQGPWTHYAPLLSFGNAKEMVKHPACQSHVECARGPRGRYWEFHIISAL